MSSENSHANKTMDVSFLVKIEDCVNVNAKTSFETTKKDIKVEDSVDKKAKEDSICLYKTDNSMKRKRDSADRAAKSHKELANKIAKLYETLPDTFILHKTFHKVSKIQKLDQIEKFILNVKRHGYIADERAMSK